MRKIGHQKLDLRGIGIAAAIVTIITVIDLTVRSNILFNELRPRDWIIYLLSYSVEVLLLWGVFLTAAILKNFRWIIIIAFGILYNFVILASLEFYGFFQSFPGLYAFHAIFDQTQESLAMTKEQITFIFIVKILTLTVIIVFGASLSWRINRNNRPVTGIIVLILACINMIPIRTSGAAQRSFPTLGAMVISREGRSLPFSHTIVCFSLGLTDYLIGRITQSGLQKRAVLPLQKINRSTDRNALLIISESVRRHNLSLFNYARHTTPGIESFRDRYAESFIEFPRAFSNATLTSVSVSFLLAGLSPAEGIDRLQRSYLLHEIIGTLENIKIAYITSWSYVPSRYKIFINANSVDWFYSQENNNQPIINDVGADDSVIPEQFSAFLDSISDNNSFFAALHFSNTHHPYYSPQPGPWGSRNMVDKYDSAILYQDRLITSIMQTLEKQGRLHDTLVIYTSDHGEGFGMERPLGHGGPQDIYSIGIPIWVFAPTDDRFADLRTSLRQSQGRNVCNADLGPTILAFFGFDPKAIGTTRPGLLSHQERSDPIYAYDWRLGFGGSGKDFLGIVLDDYLLNAIYHYGTTSYRLTNLSSPHRQRSWADASYAIKSEFLRALKKHKGLQKFLQDK